MHNDTMLKVSNNTLIPKPLHLKKTLVLFFFAVFLKKNNGNDFLMVNRNRTSNSALYLPLINALSIPQYRR